MRLSPHDLEQMDEAYLRSLELEALRAVSERLLQDLKELYERLHQTPRNSSLPPSSRPAYLGQLDEATAAVPAEAAGTAEEMAADADQTAVSEVASPPYQAAADRSQLDLGGTAGSSPQPARRPGKPLGAPGHGRTQVIPPPTIHYHQASHCAACGAALPTEAPLEIRLGFYTLDLELGTAAQPGRRVLCTLPYDGDTTCPCGHQTRTPPTVMAEALVETGASVTGLSEWRLVGPWLAALIVCLALRMRLSRARIQEWLKDWFQLELSIGLINQVIHEAGLAAAPVTEQLLEELRQADLLQVDETPWKEHGQVLWLWVFVTATVVLFVVGRRTRQVLQQVLTEALAGWLMSDGPINYRDYPRRLRCLAHLERKARGLCESVDREAPAFGQGALLVLKVVFQQVRDGPDPPVYHPLRRLFREYCQLHHDLPHEKAQALAREFLNDWDAIWAVLEHPDLPATNNAAEQALRHWVIARLISQGTRTPQGSRVFSILTSVIETCRVRKILPWPYLALVIAERRQGHPAPPLPAAA